MTVHPRYLEIIAYIDSYRYHIESLMKKLITDNRNGLEKLIDEATGYDKKIEQKRKIDIKKLIVWLKTKAKLEKIINSSDYEITNNLLIEIKQVLRKQNG
jgi:hypothetical protein